MDDGTAAREGSSRPEHQGHRAHDRSLLELGQALRATDSDLMSTDDTRIRPAVDSDAPTIARIHMASRAATMPYLPPQRRDHEQVTKWVRDDLLREGRTWVAVRGDVILGYAALKGDLLEHLYVRPDMLREGIGTLLLDEVKRHSPEGVSLHVFQQNTGARKFYERHGFSIQDTNDGERNMESLPDMTLRWTPAAD